ncbi:FAD-binding oxidoreductase [Pseudomonas sp. Bout1]|uniref:FAD-binding oxidoreductase n=1 Tax=Pseudomonas sp. Bout1 TaxID=3048600 RepID=UPI002AB534F0|nr:FAD-binding oxidoreductase [Pseudomonas sp. Bout1]MDY7533066.1 FAD-binding oxidoreductase [Pseudomonas sp. Bout1]MEB0184453.1 FAD-binding oxidoreductase [Pseudomonas sp. Bout1]
MTTRDVLSTDRTEFKPAISAGVVPAGLLQQLHAVVGEGGMLTGEDVSSRHPGVFMARIEADAILRPTTSEQVSQILALCNAARQPVVVQGGMSGWVRATQTRPGDVVVSLERMNRIEHIDLENRTATVQAGVILETLQDHVQPSGLSFALDLGGRGSCQLGGNAATNAGGVRVIRYGMMREQILGMEVVLADGRIVSSLNRMLKNNTGYDLKQLFIGSEGTLGVITRLVLRLRELPSSSNTAMVCASRFEQLAKLLRHMDGALGGQLSAFEMIDNNFYRVNTRPGRHQPPLPVDKPYYAIIETLGADQPRDTELFEKALEAGIEKGLIDDAVIARSEREKLSIWEIREDLEHLVKDFRPFYAFDISLPVGDMEAYMAQVTARLHQRWPEGLIAFLGHVGDGNLHIAIGAGTDDEREPVEACVYEPLAAYQGSVSAEHGIGLEKKHWFPISRTPIERALMQNLKDLLDPNGILNPGKIFDTEPGSAAGEQAP